MATLEPTLLFHRLFDHIPGVHFFAKNREGHLMFASRGLLERYQMSDDTEFIGRTDFDINPDTMAQAYVDDDKRLLAGDAKIIERIELWWDRQGMPDWFLVTKLPLFDKRGRVQGVMGTLRRPDEAERQLPVFQTVAQAVDIIRRDYSRPVVIADIARHITLVPGDTILMGTPCHSRSVDAGQVVECEITGLGRLRGTVVAIDPPRASALGVGHAPADTPEVRRVALGFDERVPERLRENLRRARSGG
jgi:hypothetical protein